MEAEILLGDIVYLKKLTVDDVSQDYVNWMNDYDVIKYTESKSLDNTLDSTIKYVSMFEKSNRDILFGIFLKDSNKHIGNIKLGNIHPIHKHADIGLIIGQKEYWGKHIATSAINLVTKFAFDKLDLHKLYAGVYSLNVGSMKAFINSSYHLSYIKKDEVLFEDKWLDCIVLEKFNPRHIERY